MITLFKKLQSEDLLKKQGMLLDLGSGDGSVAKAFLEFGYNLTLLDKNPELLELAKKNLGDSEIKTVNENIENFKFENKYDGIIISNVLPFVTNKEKIEEIVRNAFDNLNKGGFLFFTLFGDKDEWKDQRKDTMSFYTKEEAGRILKEIPYFQSEDYGKGKTMKGDMKTWHILYFLYLK